MYITNTGESWGEFDVEMMAKGKYILTLSNEAEQGGGRMTQESFFYHPERIQIGKQIFPLQWEGVTTARFKPIIPRWPDAMLNVAVLGIEGNEVVDVKCDNAGVIVVEISKGGEPTVPVKFKIRWEKRYNLSPSDSGKSKRHT